MHYFYISIFTTLVATDDSQRLIAFFKDEFDLDMNSDPSFSTTQHGTTINAVFMRGLENHKSTYYILVIPNRL